MAHAHKGKKKVSKKMGEILKAPKKAEKAVKAAVKYVNHTHWDTIEEFTTAINKIGLKPDQINILAEWDLYQSDTKGYRNHLKLEN
ncbi:MAG: hypothetical protein JKY05_04795 [SAR324 cluster bacterium]|nr:hypothetical protein [SAR324 cluster bacterium]